MVVGVVIWLCVTVQLYLVLIPTKKDKWKRTDKMPHTRKKTAWKCKPRHAKCEWLVLVTGGSGLAEVCKYTVSTDSFTL